MSTCLPISDAARRAAFVSEAAQIGVLEMEVIQLMVAKVRQTDTPLPELIRVAETLSRQRRCREQAALELDRKEQRQQYLDLQEQKRLDAKERSDNLADHRKKTHHLAVKRLKLGCSKFKHYKKQAKKREEEKQAKATAVQEKAQAAQTQQAKEQSPRTLPKLILTPVSPGPQIEAMRIAAGIPKGGVPTTGAAAWYYDDKPELKAERETEAAEMAEIRIESDAMYEAKQKGDEAALTAAQARHAALVEKATRRQEKLRAKKLKEDIRILDEKRKAYDRDHPREMRPVADEQAYLQKVYQERQAAYEETDEDDQTWQPPQPDTSPQPPCALSQPTALRAVGHPHDDTIPQPPHLDTPDPDPPDLDDPPTRLELYQQERRERKEARNKLLTELGRQAAYEHKMANKWW